MISDDELLQIETGARGVLGLSKDNNRRPCEMMFLNDLAAVLDCRGGAV